MYLCMCVRACVEFVNYNMLRHPCHISKPIHDDDNCRSVKQTRQIGGIAATGILILLKLDSNRRFFCQCDLDIWRMTSKHNSTPLLYYVKLCASFQSHQKIQTRLTVRKRPIWVKIGDFLCRVTLKFDRLPWKTIGHLSHATPTFVHDFITMCEFKQE